MTFLFKNDLFKAVSSILQRLPKKSRWQYWVLLLMLVGFAFLETIAAGALAIYASSIVNPEEIFKSSSFMKVEFLIPAQFLKNELSIIALLSVVVFTVILLKNSLKALMIYLIGRYSAFVSAFYGEFLLRGFLSLPYEWYINENSAELGMVILWRKYIGDLMRSFLRVASDCLVVTVLFATIFLIDPILSPIVFLVFGSGSYLLFRMVKNPIDTIAKKNSNYNLSIHRNVTKCIHGLKDVKIFCKEKLFMRDFLKEVKIFSKLSALQGVLTESPSLFLETMGISLLMLSVAALYFLMDSSPTQTTGIVAFLAVVAWRGLPAINRILASFAKIRSYLPYIDKCFNYIDLINKKVNGSNLGSCYINKKTIEFKNDIKVNDIVFRYQGSKRNLFEGVGVKIEKGKTLGIIGISGSGKSTLADIIMGLLNVESGKIYVDGVPISRNNKRSWTKKIGYVPQFPYIYDGTLSENIAFGLKRNEIDTKKVRQACKMAALNELISTLPDDIETEIGERGIKLSGGQRQRVAIARAIYCDPEILIFDEATSSLDTKSEKKVQKTIENLKGKLTMIIIAHRLTTVNICDSIIWIENGRIKKVGKYDEIIPFYKYEQNLDVDVNK